MLLPHKSLVTVLYYNNYHRSYVQMLEYELHAQCKQASMFNSCLFCVAIIVKAMFKNHFRSNESCQSCLLLMQTKKLSKCVHSMSKDMPITVSETSKGQGTIVYACRKLSETCMQKL